MNKLAMIACAQLAFGAGVASAEEGHDRYLPSAKDLGWCAAYTSPASVSLIGAASGLTAFAAITPLVPVVGIAGVTGALACLAGRLFDVQPEVQTPKSKSASNVDDVKAEIRALGESVKEDISGSQKKALETIRDAGRSQATRAERAADKAVMDIHDEVERIRSSNYEIMSDKEQESERHGLSRP